MKQYRVTISTTKVYKLAADSEYDAAVDAQTGWTKAMEENQEIKVEKR